MSDQNERKKAYQLESMEEYEFDTILEEDISFSGSLSFKKPFLIKGQLNGEIRAEGPLLIAGSARVEANIDAPQVLVRGYVKGNIVSSARVDVAASGTVIGNINAPEVFMESGCVFNGTCTMDSDQH